MSEPVFVLAVWHVVERRWAALFSSPDRARIDAAHEQLVSLVMVFTEVIEVRRDDVELIEACLLMLPKVHPEAVFQSYFDLVEFVSADGVPGAGSARPVN